MEHSKFGCSFEGLMLKLKLQYFGHLMWRADSFEKTLTLGKIEGRRRRGRQDEMVGWHHQLNGHGFGWTLGVGDGQGGLECCSSWGHKESDTTEQLNWTEHSNLLKKVYAFVIYFSTSGIIYVQIYARLLCPSDFPGKNIGVGCPALLQGIFPTQRLNPQSLISPAFGGRFFTPSATCTEVNKY